MKTLVLGLGCFIGVIVYKLIKTRNKFYKEYQDKKEK